MTDLPVVHHFTVSNLALASGTQYFATLFAMNGAGQVSLGSSDGLTVVCSQSQSRRC